MFVAAYEHTPGQDDIAIVEPAPGAGYTEDEIWAMKVPNNTTWIVVEADTLPATRDLRGCWIIANDRVVEDRAKAITFYSAVYPAKAAALALCTTLAAVRTVLFG